MKQKTKVILSHAVDQILWEEWDPFGVNKSPSARGEYTHFAKSVVRLLVDGADAMKLVRHLRSLEGAPVDYQIDERNERTAQALLEAYRKCT